MSSVEDSAAALGLMPVWEAGSLELPEVYLWPENVDVWRFFQGCGTQWLSGVGGPTGLNYPGIETDMRLSGVKKSLRRDWFAKIKVMERAMLSAWSEKRNG